MNPTELLTHFDRLSEAPDALHRLRCFILDLAVRGRLVPQDPKDEPAADLVKRIEEEVGQRRKAGELRTPRNAIDIPIESLPFTIPSSWRWGRLVELADVSYGFAFESSRFNSDKAGMPLIRIRDISNLDTEAYYDGTFDRAYVVRPGDYLVGMDGDFNVRKWKGPEALLNQRVMRVTNWRDSLVPDFLAIPLQIILDHLHASTSQTTVKHLSAKQANGIYLPLPPLAEQRRIVAKVNELMALCDRLEAAQIEREARRDRVASASLNRLSGANTSLLTLREYARFHVRQLTRLTTRPEHIQQLRETILNLAVRGRLACQDHKDESIIAVLARAHATTVRKGSDVGSGHNRVATVNATPFARPRGWATMRLGDVCSLVTSGSRGWANYVSKSGATFIRAQNIRFGRLRLQDLAHVTLPRKAEATRTQVFKGDILIVITGAGVTNPALVDVELGDAYVSQHVALVRPATKDISRWLLMCLMAPAAGRAELLERAYGAGKPGLNLDNIRSLRIPLAPVAEQHRIIAKVDELMALCDGLMDQLDAVYHDARRLFELLLREALKPAA